MARHLVAALALATLTACQPPEPPSPTFRYHLVAEPSTLDPALSGSVFDGGVIDRIFDGLVRLDRVLGLPGPALAERWEISADGRLYTFHLRRGAQFHDGREIHAADFIASWQRMLAPGEEAPMAWIFDLVEGMAAFRRGDASSVSGLGAAGPYLLRIRLERPFTPFLYHLAGPAASVVPVEDAETLGEAFGRRPVGSGPYRLVRWEEGRLELEAVDDPVRPGPWVRRLVYEMSDREQALRRYQEGEIDLVSELPAGSLGSLRETFPRDLRLFPGAAWYGLCFRADRRPFEDPRVRRGLALAIDRDALVGELGDAQHTAAFGFVPQSIPGHDPATLGAGYDLGAAKALLADAGFPGGEGFPELVYFTRGGELEEEVARFVLHFWSDLGIRGEVRPLDFDQLLEARGRGELLVYRRAWGGEYPDPEPYLRPLFHSRGGSNRMSYQDPEVDRLLDAAQSEASPDRRHALYRQAEARIVEAAPCVALYQRHEAILLRPEWQNLPIGYDPRYLEIEEVRWETGR